MVFSSFATNEKNTQKRTCTCKQREKHEQWYQCRETGWARREAEGADWIDEKKDAIGVHLAGTREGEKKEQGRIGRAHHHGRWRHRIPIHWKSVCFFFRLHFHFYLLPLFFFSHKYFVFDPMHYFYDDRFVQKPIPEMKETINKTIDYCDQELKKLVVRILYASCFAHTRFAHATLSLTITRTRDLCSRPR